jgi:triosephosphate isomerase (TIM)
MLHTAQLPRTLPRNAVAKQSRGFRKETCMKSTAKFFVGGNWKANGSVDAVADLVSGLNRGRTPSDVDVVVAPPCIYLDYSKKNLTPRYQVAAQNCWLSSNGAFTGETTADMLVDFGIPWVILGHSERRSIFGEQSEVVGKKCAYALSKGLKIIPCIGETLQQRESGEMFNVLDEQVQALFDNIDDWSNVVLAYEPVWAIGTGVVASPAQAQEVHAYLRSKLEKELGVAQGQSTRIIYGGSVSDANCVELGGQEDIDGFLVGGASLKATSFVQICNATSGA